MAKRKARPAPVETPANAETFESGMDTAIDQAADSGRGETRSDSMGSEPSDEDIRMRAYSRYLERGGGDGQHFEDWLEAERELKKSR
jgi:hypothetical protein